MLKITEIMSTFIVSLLCNTIRKTAEHNASAANVSVVEKYKYLLTEKCRMLDTNEGIQNYIKDFSVYCSSIKYHPTYEQLFIDVVSEFCPPDIMDQMGQQQRQSVSRGIFSKTFKESADLLIKSPDILSIVANGAANSIGPCKKLVSVAIDNIKTELMSRRIRGNDSNIGDKVPASLYQTVRAKYDKLCSVNSVLSLELDRSIEKVKTLSEELKKLNATNRTLKLRLKEIETKTRVPTEITISGGSSHSARTPPSVPPNVPLTFSIPLTTPPPPVMTSTSSNAPAIKKKDPVNTIEPSDSVSNIGVEHEDKKISGVVSDKDEDSDTFEPVDDFDYGAFDEF